MFTNEKKTRVEILKFESKKMRVELKKKYSSRERENADQLCFLSMSSLHRYEASIQFFLLPWQTYRGLRKAAQFSFIKMTAQNSYFGVLTSTKGHCLATLSSRYCETYGCLEIGKFTLSTLNRTGTHRFNHQKPSREVMIKSQLAEQGHPTTIFGRISVRKTI